MKKLSLFSALLLMFFCTSGIRPATSSPTVTLQVCNYSFGHYDVDLPLSAHFYLQEIGDGSNPYIECRISADGEHLEFYDEKTKTWLDFRAAKHSKTFIVSGVFYSPLKR